MVDNCTHESFLQQWKSHFIAVAEILSDSLYFRRQLLTWTTFFFFSITACLTNALCITVLSRRKLNQETQQFRKHFLILAVSEIVACMLQLCYFLMVGILLAILLPFETQINQAILVFSVVVIYILMYVAMVCRNWVIAAISVSQCETMLRPFATKKEKVVTDFHFKVLFTISLLACTLHVVMVVCYGTNENCQEANNNTYLGPEKGFKMPNIINRPFFLWLQERALPIIIVLLSMIITFITLLRKKERPEKAYLKKAHNAAKATIALSLCFMLSKGVGLLFLVSNIFFDIPDTVGYAVYTIERYLQMISSSINLFILIIFSRNFRQEMLRMICYCY